MMSVIINPNSVLLLEVDSNLQQQNVKQPFYILQIDDIPCIDSWLLPSPLPQFFPSIKKNSSSRSIRLSFEPKFPGYCFVDGRKFN